MARNGKYLHGGMRLPAFIQPLFTPQRRDSRTRSLLSPFLGGSTSAFFVNLPPAVRDFVSLLVPVITCHSRSIPTSSSANSCPFRPTSRSLPPLKSHVAKPAAKTRIFPSTGFLPTLMNRPGMFEFVLAAPVCCPLCHGPVAEKTLVDRAGGMEVFA